MKVISIPTQSRIVTGVYAVFPCWIYCISFQESVRAAFVPAEKLDKVVTLNLLQSGALLLLLRKIMQLLGLQERSV